MMGLIVVVDVTGMIDFGCLVGCDSQLIRLIQILDTRISGSSHY